MIPVLIVLIASDMKKLILISQTVLRFNPNTNKAAAASTDATKKWMVAFDKKRCTNKLDLHIYVKKKKHINFFFF